MPFTLALRAVRPPAKPSSRAAELAEDRGAHLNPSHRSDAV
ncbi:MAG TPA: hypothetical protein VGO40_02725 [Longimicrobium sp.]|jgi:hypothetical protein|nr:hypothetical protein [Longimicrobium sp.]